MEINIKFIPIHLNSRHGFQTYQPKPPLCPPNIKGEIERERERETERKKKLEKIIY